MTIMLHACCGCSSGQAYQAEWVGDTKAKLKSINWLYQEIALTRWGSKTVDSDHTLCFWHLVACHKKLHWSSNLLVVTCWVPRSQGTLQVIWYWLCSFSCHTGEQCEPTQGWLHSTFQALKPHKGTLEIVFLAGGITYLLGDVGGKEGEEGEMWTSRVSNCMFGASI